MTVAEGGGDKSEEDTMPSFLKRVLVTNHSRGSDLLYSAFYPFVNDLIYTLVLITIDFSLTISVCPTTEYVVTFSTVFVPYKSIYHAKHSRGILKF